MKKWFWHDRIFHSRFEMFSFWVKVLLRFLSLFFVVGVFVSGFVFVSVFGVPNWVSPGHGEDVRSLYIDESDVDVVSSRYDEGLEKGFCVYGDYSRVSVSVEEIVHDDDVWSQSETSVGFNCLDETVRRIPRLVGNGSYRFIGIVHTHPEYDRLSRPDSFIFGLTAGLVEVSGVYDGEELEFYSSRSLSYGLGKFVES